MPVSVVNMKDALLPGLWAMKMTATKVVQWDALFAEHLANSIPSIPLGPGVVLAVGAAGVIIQNPEVSRRELLGLGANE